MSDFVEDQEVLLFYKETFNEQLKFCFGTSPCFVTKYTLLLDENGENLISANLK